MLYNEYIKPLSLIVQKKNIVGGSQLFLSIDELKHFLPSLLVESFAIHKSCENIALDCISSATW